MDVSVELEPEAAHRCAQSPRRVATLARVVDLICSPLLRLIVVGITLGLGLSLWGIHFGTDPASQLEWQPVQPSQSLIDALIPHRAVALGPGPGGRDDIHLSWVRATPEGVTLSTFGAVNLSRSPLVDEELATTTADLIAYGVPSHIEGAAFEAIEIIALAPSRQRARKNLSLLQQSAIALTNLELNGQVSRPWRARVELNSLSGALELRWQGSRLEAQTDEGIVILNVSEARLEAGETLAELTEHAEGCPDLFRWAVDQLRYSRFIGPDRLQLLEHLYLELYDVYTGMAENQGAQEEQGSTTRTLIERLGRPVPPSTDDDRPWPPQAITPKLSPTLEGEGLWQERDSRFVTEVNGAPPLLLTTFIRTDRERPNTSRVFMTAWNPEWLELDWVAGTMEPRSTIGLRGNGQVPAAALERLVAGFNGGFQAVDGAFGVKTRRGEFIPPLPYSATVAQTEGDRLVFGSWPGSASPPVDLVAYRQNLTALVENGQVNPYGRRFWGGVPANLRDTTRTDRTGLCLTSNHNLIYFWGQRVTVEALADAMVAARCDYGMLLDINFSNTVFETYRIAPRGELPPVERALDEDWELEGTVPGREDLSYRVQAMAPGMTRVGFPRYIRTELRDFFYLALRPAALSAPVPDLCPLSPLDDGRTGPPRAWRCEIPTDEGESMELFQVDPGRLDVELVRSGSQGSGWLSWPVSASMESPSVNARLLLLPGAHGGTGAEISDRAPLSTTQGLALDGIDLEIGVNSGQRTVATTSLDSIGLVVAISSRGDLALGTASFSHAQALRGRLAASGYSRAIFIPHGRERLVLSPDSTPMALRIFSDTLPAHPRVWAPIHRRAQERIDELGLTRQYVQIRDYVERDRPRRR